MRRWRVGTISMGIALILLGVVLMMAQFTGLDVIQLASAWWPAILIVLGIEVIAYLFFSNQEKPIIKYDIVSILFIGLLGTVGILFFMVSSVGLLEEVQGAMKSERVHGTLPSIEQTISSDIKKIVLETGHEELDIEANDDRKLHLFGTYQSTFGDNLSLEEKDLASITKAGSTLYIQLLEGPRKEGIHYRTTRYDRTISLPDDVAVEIRGNHETLYLNVDKLNADWMVDRAGNVVLGIKEDADVTVKLESFNEGIGWDIEWDKEDKIGNEEKGNTLFYKEKQFGDGNHVLQFNILDNFTIKQVGPRL